MSENAVRRNTLNLSWLITDAQHHQTPFLLAENRAPHTGNRHALAHPNAEFRCTRTQNPGAPGTPKPKTMLFPRTARDAPTTSKRPSDILKHLEMRGRYRCEGHLGDEIKLSSNVFNFRRSFLQPLGKVPLPSHGCL
jgi:hypothetical protein